MKNVLDTAELKGLKKGLEQGALEEKIKNAKVMKVLGLTLGTIAKVTGMSVEDIEKL
jgi:predicted transposase/invertase (TIGR01784 family)